MFNLKIVQVKEESMTPRLKNNAFLLIKKNYSFRKLSRNDIVVFRSNLDKNYLFIKRIIGKPGDLIQILNTGQILINTASEPQTKDSKQKTDSWVQFSWDLSEKEFIVLGDNRSVSEDSRKFGPINYEQIIGKAIFNLTSLRFLK